MTPDTILLLIIAIAALSYVLDQILDYLNFRHIRRDIPEDVAEFYDRQSYIRSLNYHRDRAKLSFFSSGLSFAVSMALLLGGGFGWLDQLLRNLVGNEIVLSLMFFGVLMVAADILTLPLQLYSVFVIEEKYGFNKMNGKTFILDKLKSYFLAALIGAPLLAALIFLIKSIGPTFWVWFAMIASLFIVGANMFYTTLILPLFNKLTPLAEGELKSSIEDFARKVNFPLDNVFVIDGSRRSSKANAFFSGFGRKKKIVLYDTLIEKHSTPELVAVLAHEVGHFKKKHIVLGMALAIIQIFFTMFVLSLMVYEENLSIALGGSQHSIHLNLVAFSLLFTPISGITGLLMNIYSRKNEYEADAYAKDSFSGPALENALKKLSVDSLSNLYPHPAYVFVHYSHPPLLRRLAALRSG